jgi:hypothetical protein
VTEPIIIDFSPNMGAHGGISQSLPDKAYRWSMWRFWDVGRPYINFIGLCPRATVEAEQQDRIEAWLTRWERGADRAAWKVGGYVVTNLFGRVCDGAGALRRLSHGGDVVGARNTDALMTFAAKASMIVMLPGVDEALDVRPEHQRLVLSALTGLQVPVAVIDRETQMPREFRG